jgi:C_GCAxxG_C_C family probable redox protein
MSKKEKAVKLFELRFNCSQAIFAAYCQGGELDEVTALKLSTVFGAGVACTGQGPCGAVAGALMALSMKHGRGDLESVDAKTETYEIGRQFMAEFKARNGSCVCEQILGMNIGTAKGHKKAQAAGLFETKCLDAVKSAADILDEML